MQSRETDPFALFETLVNLPSCHMHGPEHHVIVGAALLTAYQNAGGDIQLEQALYEIVDRASKVPGGACAYWGACGACVSAGMFISIITKAAPLSQEVWGLPSRMTAQALGAISVIGGPRCCKRNSYLAIGEAIRFTAQNLGVQMDSRAIVCTRSAQNPQCIGSRCPFHNASEKE